MRQAADEAGALGVYPEKLEREDRDCKPRRWPVGGGKGKHGKGAKKDHGPPFGQDPTPLSCLLNQLLQAAAFQPLQRRPASLQDPHERRMKKEDRGCFMVRPTALCDAYRPADENMYLLQQVYFLYRLQQLARIDKAAARSEVKRP